MRAAKGANFRIEVDGGIALSTIGDVVRAGAEVLVSGNAVFGQGDPKKNVQELLKTAREATLLPPEPDTAEFDALFDASGHWAAMPADWGNPDATLGQKQFFAALEECLGRLPKKTSDAFMLREHLGLETGEICKELGVTPTHCWVLLYRARMALRECLETNWFRK